MRFPVFAIAFSLLAVACAVDESTYDSWENSRSENCKQRYSPYDPELEYCLERAEMPYEEYEKQRSGTDTQSEKNHE